MSWPRRSPSIRTAVRLRPDHGTAHANLGVVLRDRGELAEAADEFRTAVRLRPDDKTSYVNLGSLLANAEHDYKGAVAALRTAIRLRPDDAQAHTGLGIALGRQGKLAEAIAALRTAIRLQPDDAEAHSNLGVALGFQQKLAEAIAELRASIRLRPDDAKTRCNLGLALHGRGDLAGAEAEFRTALKIEPGWAEAHCHLGQVLQAQGRFEEGLAELRSGHELGSGRPDWRFPSGRWVRDAERLVGLSRRLPAVLEGDDIPKDAAEWLEFARMCAGMCRHAAAARLYASALQVEPRPADSQRDGLAHAAACNAALAGCGQGKDVPRPDEAARAQLRGQALGLAPG